MASWKELEELIDEEHNDEEDIVQYEPNAVKKKNKVMLVPCLKKDDGSRHRYQKIKMGRCY